MADNRNHTWQNKLSQVPLPDEGEAWGQMQSMLDKHLPVQQRRSKRSLFIVTLLLLFVIGICNCPNSRKSASQLQGLKKDTIIATAPSDPEMSSTTQTPIESHPVTSTANHSEQTQPTWDADQANVNLSQKQQAGIILVKKRPKENTVEYAPTSSVSSVHSTKPTPSGPETKSASGKVNAASIVSEPEKTDHKVAPLSAPDSAFHALTEKEKSDTTVKKDTVTITKDSATQPLNKPIISKRLSLGIGFNQVFAIGEQEWTPINQKATYSGWHQWIPVLNARYYMTSRLFLQGEVQFGAPQYTPAVLLSQTVVPAPGPGPGPAATSRIEKSVYSKKLFYLDMPVSVHMQVAPHFFVGAGVQYSRLQQAVSLYEEKRLTTGQPDTLLLRRYQRLNDRSGLHQQEWRYMMSAAARLKRFDAGFRYTRSLRPFVTTAVPPNLPPNLHNQSLLFFVRYEFLHTGNRSKK